MLKIIILINLLMLLFLSYSIIPTYFYKIKSYIHKRKDEKKIYLTFDDGPSEYTNDLLNLLDFYHVKATFFVVSKFAYDNPNIISRIKDEGHLIGLHSYEHKNALVQLPTETIIDFKSSMNSISKFNIGINYYRPPWGHINLYTLIEIRKYKLKLFLWNVMVGDWKGNISSNTIAKNILKRVKNGSIICLHDGRGKNFAPKRTIEALKIAIPILLEKGYLFQTADLYEK